MNGKAAVKIRSLFLLQKVKLENCQKRYYRRVSKSEISSAVSRYIIYRRKNPEIWCSMLDGMMLEKSLSGAGLRCLKWENWKFRGNFCGRFLGRKVAWLMEFSNTVSRSISR